MKLTALFALLAATLAGSAPTFEAAPIERSGTVSVAHSLSKRGCYSGGESWGNQLNTAYQVLSYACGDKTFVTGCGPGCGNYPPFYRGEVRTRCFDIGGNKRMNLRLKYHGSESSRRIDYTECYDGFIKEMKGCAHGGSTAYGNWEYTADPNTGYC